MSAAELTTYFAADLLRHGAMFNPPHEPPRGSFRPLLNLFSPNSEVKRGVS